MAAIPFSTFVVKVASRCNLNCSYCYMYNLRDKTYLGQPAVMSTLVREAMCDRIIDHAREHNLLDVHIILHGGEPLLIGKKNLKNWVESVRSRFDAEKTTPHFSVQSNGVLIDDEWIELLFELNVRIGLSIDGPKSYHDAVRIDHSGRGSYDDVVAAIKRLRTHPLGKEIFSNVMAVVNPEIDPVEMYSFWDIIDVRGFDINLPHANHVYPPPYPISKYGDWMINFFDCWYFDNNPDRHVRFFENFMRMLFRYPFSTDNIGGRPVNILVVETDGSLEPTDAFKCSFDGVTKLGADVFKNSLSSVSSHPLIKQYQEGAGALCEVCSNCQAKEVCGGGYMPHRYGNDETFLHPSVYCDALLPLSRHIRRRILESMPDQMARRLQ
ncbi:radical SAM protein [Rhizobium leguminosarum bv. viciae]|nr:radical SAM protein [Rhizobium leguminosarum bv. viciae]